MQSLAKGEHPQGRLESRLSDSRCDKWLQACRARQNKVPGPVLQGSSLGLPPLVSSSTFPIYPGRVPGGLGVQTHPEGSDSP